MAFYGENVLISGGASGLGKVHALELDKVGANVFLLDIDKDKLKSICKLSERFTPFECDVTNLSHVESIVKIIEYEYGYIDRLIHCAAVMPGGLLSESTAESLANVMHINYTGMVNICQSIVPDMVKRNMGDVIIYGSTAGIVHMSKFGSYGASKAANNFYARVLMEEHKDSAVRFQLVCPPAVDTPLINQAKDNGPNFLTNIQKTKKNLITPEYVVNSVEKCLEKGRKINYPGPARYVRYIYPLLPSLVKRMA